MSQPRRTSPFKLAATQEITVPGIAPGGKVELRAEVTPLRRGVLRLEGLLIARPDPLGLFRALTQVPLPQSLLILPKRYLLPPSSLKP